MKKRKKFYITSSIVYTNAPPHVGFALETIQADVLARYHRNLGEKVFFLTGTDENGLKNAQTAERVGKTPQEFVDEISGKFRELTKVLNLSNNDFIRTTDKKRHWPTVQKVWLKLKNNGDIYKKKYRGLYCIGCEAFLKEKDLINGKCLYHQKKPEVIEEENYFFRLSKYQNKIAKVIREEKIKIIPRFKKNEILNFISQGIEDISCSRPTKKLKWGIPVPDDSSQIIYIWLEALLNYISALDYAKNGINFRRFWPADVHCVGKDILKFHCLLWPAILLSLKIPLPRTIFVHGFLTIAGQKISKSLGNVISPFELVKKYGTDAVRYFLLREIPPCEDGDFTYEKFEQRYNSDLAAGLGNLVARVLTMVEKVKMKDEKLKIATKNLKFKKEVKKIWKNYHQALNEFKFNEALILIWNLIGFCDRYIESQRPWRLLPKICRGHEEMWRRDARLKLKEILSNLLFVLDNIAQMLQPFLPETSEKIFSQIKVLSCRKRRKLRQFLFPKLETSRKV